MAKKKKEQKIPDVLVYTDINCFNDDLASMVVLAYLAEHKKINIRGIITELGTYEVRRRRAMYAKGAMVRLGQPYLRAVPGGDYVVQNPEQENYYPENEFTRLFEDSGTAILRSGTTFVQEYFKSVKDKNIVILLNAPFPDFAKFIEATHDTVKKKVKKIVVMGSVLSEKDPDGHYIPNPECFNFAVGYPAVRTLFEYAREKDVRLALVQGQDIRSTGLDTRFLNAITSSRHPVARQLLQSKQPDECLLFDMVSALAVADQEFKAAGGMFEKEENATQSVFFARIKDPNAMNARFCEIFKEVLLPKKITLAQLTRKTSTEKEENSKEKA